MSALLRWLSTSPTKVLENPEIRSFHANERAGVRQELEADLSNEIARSRPAQISRLPRWFMRVAPRDTWDEFISTFDELDGFTPEELRNLEANLNVELSPGETVETVLQRVQPGYARETSRWLRAHNVTRQALRTAPVTYPAPEKTLDDVKAPEEKIMDPNEVGRQIASADPPPAYTAEQRQRLNDALSSAAAGERTVNAVTGQLLGAFTGNKSKKTTMELAVRAWRDKFAAANENTDDLYELSDALGLPGSQSTNLDLINQSFAAWILQVAESYRDSANPSRLRKTRRKNEDDIAGYGLRSPGKTIRAAYSKFRMV